MKTSLVTLFAALALTVGATAALAQHDHQAMAAKADAPKAEAPKSLTGEIVDMGCFLGHGAKGAEHASCATKCISNGMPMGLLTADGTVYLLTMSHETADPFNKAKTLASKTVTISGPISERGGIKAIEVVSIATSDKS